jgi:trigger factor
MMTADKSPQAEFERLSDTRYKIKVSVPPDSFQKKLDETYSELSKHASIPGFRPGKAPRNLLNRYFSPERIIKETADEVVEATFWPVIEKKELTIVGAPHVEQGEWREGEDFTYEATVDVLPPIPQINYEEIKITLPVREVTDEMLEDEIRAFRIRLAEATEIKGRSTQAGDFVIVAFEGLVPDVTISSVEGDAPWGFKDEKMAVELGGGKALPGLEDALLGMELEEIREFELVLPGDFSEPRVRGKSLKAKARLTSIRHLERPELTEQFITDKFGDSGIESIEQLKGKITEELNSTFAQVDDRETIDQIESFFSRNVMFPVPESMLRAEFIDILDRTLNHLKQKDVDINALMEDGNERGRELRKRAWFQAERLNRVNTILREIARKENVKTTAEDVVNYITMLAYRRGLKEKDIKALLSDRKFLEETRDEIQRKQVTHFLLGRVKPERIPMEQFREMMEKAWEESRDHEKSAIEGMEDPFDILKRSAEAHPPESTPAEAAPADPAESTGEVPHEEDQG